LLVRQVQDKTIQVLSEQLSFGIPVLMMDIKGDFSGIAKEVLSRSATPK
jgi:hypothetical protein